jgi:hypothetical protein
MGQLYFVVGTLLVTGLGVQYGGVLRRWLSTLF